jgi:hypothetical protein
MATIQFSDDPGNKQFEQPMLFAHVLRKWFGRGENRYLLAHD